MFHQNSPNSSIHFSKHKSVPPQILHHFSVLWHIILLPFFGSVIIYFRQKFLSKFFRFVTVRIKIQQIIHVIFRTKSQFFFKLCITLSALDKRNPSECRFSDFWLLAWKLTKFLMSYFASRFIVIIPMKFSSWNIICLDKKSPSKYLASNNQKPYNQPSKIYKFEIWNKF